MKTKEFIEKVESNLFTIKESPDGTIIFIYPSRSDFNILAWVNKYENESHIYSILPKDLAESLVAYTITPIEEREEEKKYIYSFPFHITARNVETKHICRNHTFRESGESDDLIIDLSPMDTVVTNEKFFFTDKEVEKYTGKDKALFNVCKKIEVTP